MRVRALMVAATFAILAMASATKTTTALGRPGITPVPCPTQEWQLGDPKFDALPGARAFFGQYDGGLYKIEIPDSWNGELALYAHGFVSNGGAQGSALRVGNSPIREHLIKEGYAWAASSYRCNGYVPGQGLVDTMALTDLFTKANGGRAPQRVLLTGTSMGGHVTLLGMHEFPTAFAGGLAMCPAGPELFDFFAATAAAAEVITGVRATLDTMPADVAKMNEMLGKPGEYTDKGRQLASVEIRISGGPRPFAMEGLASGGRFAGNINPAALAGSTTPSNRAVMTTHITYGIDEGLGLTADALNKGARRKTLDAEVRNASGPYDELVPFDGKLERPTLTMHGTGDLFVPIFLEQALKKAVVAAGKESLLTQRIYRIAGHCGFSQAEMIKAFDDLATWVHKGTKPEGDEVDGDLSNAGMRFTNPLRPGDPGGIRVTPAGPASIQEAKVDFARDVQPILRQQCYSCHGPAKQTNGFRLDRRSDAMRGSTLNPGLIRPGHSAVSFMYMRIAGNDAGPQMPPTGALRPAQIATIRAWIDQGAEWPDALAGEVPALPTDPGAVRAAGALRAGDMAAFNAMVTADAAVAGRRGPGGSTPLMYAVLYGDLAAVRRLLDSGADPSSRNDAGATALMWAVDDLDKTRLLLDRGANPNAKSDDGRTPLIIASGRPGAAPVVTLLLDRGANINQTAPGITGETTAVAEAAYVGDEAMFRLLVHRGADLTAGGPAQVALALRAQCAACAETLLKALPPPLLTPAMVIAMPPFGDAAATNLFLDRGAEVNAKDPQGRTLLTLAAASDSMPVDVVKALLARGVDVNAKSAAGETALGHALLRGNTPVVAMLRKSGANDSPALATPAAPESPAASPRAALVRTLPLLQKTDTAFLKQAGCVSCHNNTLTAMSIADARQRGLPVDEEAARQNLRTIAAFVDSWREKMLQGIGIPGEADTVSSILLGMAAERYPADAATDAAAHFIKRQQMPNGQWRPLAHRPPLESSDIQATAFSLRALQVYGPMARRAEYERSIQLARGWLIAARPTTMQDRAFHLLGLKWANASAAAIRQAARGLMALQRPDGGWAQLTTVASDAYATGQALVALQESGALPGTDPAVKRGVQFLLNTQFADGSWFVRTRAIPLQPPMDSGFPHGRDQWISAAATNWATMALARAYRKPS